MLFISKCSFSRNCSPSHAVWPLWPVYLSRMAYLMLRSFPCCYCKVSVPLEWFPIFHLFDQFGDGCSGLLSDAFWCFGLLWAALSCSGLLLAALGCSGLLWAALGCSRLLWAALGCSGLLWAALGSSCQCETVAPRHHRDDEVQYFCLGGGWSLHFLSMRLFPGLVNICEYRMFLRVRAG